MARNDKVGICSLCSREEIYLTFHHLIPKTLHSKKWYKKNFSVEELNSGVDLCEDCHEAIHDFITEKELGKKFNSIKALMSHSKVKKFVSWIKKQKKSRIKTFRPNVRY